MGEDKVNRLEICNVQNMKTILNIYYILCMNTILLSVRNAVRTNRGLKKPNADETLKENIGVKSTSV